MLPMARPHKIKTSYSDPLPSTIAQELFDDGYLTAVNLLFIVVQE